MKKFLVVIAIVSLVFASSAFASQTKLLSLGGLPVTMTNLDQIVNVYPSLIQNFKNIAVVEMTDFDNPSAYSFIDTSLGVVGISGRSNPGIAIPGGLGMVYVLPAVTGAFYGTNLGAMNVGGYVLYGQRITDFNENIFNKEKDSTAGDNNSYIKVNVGASLKVADLPVDSSIALTIPGRIETNQVRNFNTDGKLVGESWTGDTLLAIDMNGRTKINGWMLNLMGNITTGTRSTTNMVDANANGSFTDTGDTWTIASTANTDWSVNIDGANTMKVSDTMAITYGSGLYSKFTSNGAVATLENKVAKTTTKTYDANITNTKNFQIPVYVAITCKLNETWSMSAGVYKQLLQLNYANNIAQSTTDGKKTGETCTTNLYSNGAVSGTIGVTGTIGDLSIDALLNPAILLYGPYFISGNSLGGDALASSIALNYKWGK